MKAITLITALALSTLLVPVENDITSLTNEYRRYSGSHKLVELEELNNSALDKAEHMCENNYTDHWDSTGYGFVEIISSHIELSEYGENIAWDFDTNEQAMREWKTSITHNDNMLSNQWTHIGSAKYYCEGSDKNLFVQHFGKK